MWDNTLKPRLRSDRPPYLGSKRANKTGPSEHFCSLLHSFKCLLKKNFQIHSPSLVHNVSTYLSWVHGHIVSWESLLSHSPFPGITFYLACRFPRNPIFILLRLTKDVWTDNENHLNSIKLSDNRLRFSCRVSSVATKVMHWKTKL